MNIILIDSEALFQLVELVVKRIKSSDKERPPDRESNQDWITITEAKKLLPYKSPLKWRQLRAENAIRSAKIGRVVMYSKSSIEKFILKNENL